MLAYSYIDGRKHHVFEGIQRINKSYQLTNASSNDQLMIVWYEGEPELWLFEPNCNHLIFEYYKQIYQITSKEWLRMPTFTYQLVNKG